MFKILLVEDNAYFRQSLKDLLHLQFPLMLIEEAADGNKALKKVDAFHHDLIFMDIGLPGESGLLVTEKIKKNHPGIIIIILSFSDSPQHREATSRCGADRFISKDKLTWEEVETLIKSVLSDLDGAT